jgi:hypothetical protein
MSMKSHAENGPGHVPPASASCVPSIVKRTNCTLAVVPVFSGTEFRWPRLAIPKWPDAASTKVVPSVDVSIRKSPVEALPPSPQVAFGSTAISLMLTARGSLTVTNFGPGSPALIGLSLP